MFVIKEVTTVKFCIIVAINTEAVIYSISNVTITISRPSRAKL